MLLLDIALQDLILTVPEAQRLFAVTSGTDCDSSSKACLFILSSITDKMQRYTIFFIAANAVHVSGGFSAHHQELKSVHTASGICQACLLLPLA